MRVWSFQLQRWVDMPAEWTAPIPAGRDNPVAHITRYIIGAAQMGSVYFHPGSGRYYAVTQTRRLGAYVTMQIAKEMVENYALSEAYEYPTLGCA